VLASYNVRGDIRRAGSITSIAFLLDVLCSTHVAKLDVQQKKTSRGGSIVFIQSSTLDPIPSPSQVPVHTISLIVPSVSIPHISLVTLSPCPLYAPNPTFLPYFAQQSACAVSLVLQYTHNPSFATHKLIHIRLVVVRVGKTVGKHACALPHSVLLVRALGVAGRALSAVVASLLELYWDRVGGENGGGEIGDGDDSEDDELHDGSVVEGRLLVRVWRLGISG
jgi:hypothetical protein